MQRFARGSVEILAASESSSPARNPVRYLARKGAGCDLIRQASRIGSPQALCKLLAQSE